MPRVSFNPIHSERAFDGEEAVCMTRGFDGPSPCAMALDMILVDRSDPWEYKVNTGIGTYKFLRTQPNSGLIKTAVQELNSITERLRKGGRVSLYPSTLTIPCGKIMVIVGIALTLQKKLDEMS